MSKVVSIEIGNAYTKVVLLDYKSKNTKVYAATLFETPVGTIEDGYIKNSEEFVEKLSSQMAAAGINEKKVIFTISSSKIANREVTLPLVSRDKIMSMIKANSTDYFPVDIKAYHISYTMLEKIVNKDEKKMKLLLLAAPLDLLESYFDLARIMGMTLVSIDYAGNSIFQITKGLKKTDTNVSIHINEKNTIISIMENGVLSLQRTIAYGSDSAVEAIMSIDKYRYNEDFDQDKALQLLLTTQMINTVMPEREDVAYADSELDEEERDKAEITESLRYLLGNITRVIDYFMTKSQNAKIDMIYLSGIGSEFKGLRELFSFEIGSTVKTITSIEGVQYTPTDQMASLSMMLVAIGASKEPMNLMPTEFSEKKVRKISLVIPTVILIAGLAAAAGMFAYGQISYAMERDTRDKLKKDLEDMQQYVAIKEQYDADTTIYNGVMAMDAQTVNMNEYLVAFIGEIEEKMPSSFKALSFTATEEGVSLGVTVSTLEEAAQTIRQFRTFETISVVQSSGFSISDKEEEEEEEEGNVRPVPPVNNEDEEEEEDKEKVVSFSLNITYNKDYRASLETEAE
ncbi:MAG: pilus assembly protein PilM [Lachnospiraceae bacterium]|nr:pilus assembly protein PilM [Lachnospiraceae bacterium]